MAYKDFVKKNQSIVSDEVMTESKKLYYQEKVSGDFAPEQQQEAWIEFKKHHRNLAGETFGKKWEDTRIKFQNFTPERYSRLMEEYFLERIADDFVPEQQEKAWEEFQKHETELSSKTPFSFKRAWDAGFKESIFGKAARAYPDEWQDKSIGELKQFRKKKVS